MRRPHMSTGAWIFATAALVLAVGAPISYAAVTSTVAIGTDVNSTTAHITSQHQLLTATVAARDVVRFNGRVIGNLCAAVYNPPAGKAFVLTSVTYDLGAGTAGAIAYGYLMDAPCDLSVYDIAETRQAAETQTRTYPVGLPMRSVGLFGGNAGTDMQAFFTGYLIPASQLPASVPNQAPLPAHPVPHRP